MIWKTDSICHDGHGFSNPPFFECHAFAFVISSSGLVAASDGVAMVAAYNRAAVEEVDIVRNGEAAEIRGRVVPNAPVLNNSWRKKDRMRKGEEGKKRKQPEQVSY